jgi:hypothetical protein
MGAAGRLGGKTFRPASIPRTVLHASIPRLEEQRSDQVSSVAIQRGNLLRVQPDRHPRIDVAEASLSGLDVDPAAH